MSQTTSDDEDDAFGFSVLVNADEFSYFVAIVWAEYETKDNTPTAFAAARNNVISKIIFKDGDFGVFSQTIHSK